MQAERGGDFCRRVPGPNVLTPLQYAALGAILTHPGIGCDALSAVLPSTARLSASGIERLAARTHLTQAAREDNG